jgi:hypothetical protein
MNETTLLILGTIAGVVTSISIYGVIKKERKFFLLGLFLYSLLVVPNELMAYFDSGNMVHLMTAGLWTVQFVIAFPVKASYNSTNTAAYMLVKKMLLSIIVINLCGISLTYNVDALPDFFALYHGIFCALSTLLVIKFHRGEIVAK